MSERFSRVRRPLDGLCHKIAHRSAVESVTNPVARAQLQLARFCLPGAQMLKIDSHSKRQSAFSSHLHRWATGVIGFSCLALLILSFQNCGGSGSGSGSSGPLDDNGAASTGTVQLLPEAGLSNPRLQIISDNWTSSGQIAGLSKNLGCIDALQTDFPNCSAWALVQSKQLISQAPGALLPSGVSLITDPSQLFVYADPEWGTALLAILSVTADSRTGTASGSLRSPDSSGLTTPGTLRIYRDSPRGKYAYELSEQNGFINSSGGQIEALQADFLQVGSGAPTLAHPVTLSLDARIASQHVAFYTSPNESLKVRSIFYSQATLAFKNDSTIPASLRVKNLRLRFIHGDSANYTLPAATCVASDTGYDISLQQNLPNESNRYDLRVGTALNPYKIDLNAHLCSLLSLNLNCVGQIGGQSVSQNLSLGSLPGSTNFGNWSLLTEQTGLETSKALASDTNPNQGGDALGEIGTRLQIENITATQDLGRAYSCPTGVSTRTFVQGVQTLREVCGYGAPIGSHWSASTETCYQKVIGDQHCGSGKIVKTECGVPNPGVLWTPIGDECYSFTTTTTCS